MESSLAVPFRKVRVAHAEKESRDELIR